MDELMLNSNFIKPQYEANCFANIPQTVIHLLTGTGEPTLPATVFGDLPQRYDTVILFFIDAFGWRFFEQYAGDYPFLQEISQAGVVSKLTSQFPSTTAAHVTCIHTGLTVGQSGVYEWQYYEPQLDAIITPLLFSYAGTTQRDTLKPTHIDPKRLYPTQTIYQKLQQHGVKAYLFQYHAYAHSTYTDIISAGAEIVPYKTLPEALVNLRLRLSRQTSPSYFFLYYSPIDAIGHEYGPTSPQFEAEVDAFLIMVERLFQKQLKGRLKNTLFMLVADHGLVEVDPQTTVYLNLDPQFAGIQRYFKTNGQGEFLVPGGSPRDMFLYVKDDLLDEAQAFLRPRLTGKAEVYKAQNLIEEGFFGPPPLSETFLARLGNLVILPYANETVWWYEKDKFEQRFYGHHGGLTRQEMEIPLMLYTF
jgi:predicted AlkP superfamily pyrophosphatase or phosphodiesterase